jgi:hypothetical protein
MPITLDGTNGITTPMYNGSITANAVTPVTGFKNRIINGQMTFDQRNAGASVTPTSGSTYTLDRWASSQSSSSKFSVQQNAGAVTPPTGFINYLGTTSTSAYSPTSGEEFIMYQPIEGLNISDLGWGTANAKNVTLSFWVRSSGLTYPATFGGSLRNSATNRSYPFSYTISVASTWEYKTVTIAGDTSGTWLTTNGVGLYLSFSLGAGSSRVGTASAWAGADYVSATGATSVVGTNGATLYITGVQLEVGSTATSFDYRSIGTELALCQRYYYRITPQTSSYNGFGLGYSYTTTSVRVYVPFPVTMRTTPSTFDFSSAGNYLLENNSGLSRSASTIADSTNSGNNGALLSCGVSSTTAGLVWMCLANGTTSAYMGFGAEL